MIPFENCVVHYVVARMHSCAISTFQQEFEKRRTERRLITRWTLYSIPEWNFL